MSSRTCFVSFLDNLKSLLASDHLGKTIKKLFKEGRARDSDIGVDLFPFYALKIVLFARIVIDGRKEPIKGLIVTMIIEPRKDLFLIEYLPSSVPISAPAEVIAASIKTLRVKLDKLVSLERLSRNYKPIKRKLITLNIGGRKFAKPQQVMLPPTLRRPRCSPPPIFGCQM